MFDGCSDFRIVVGGVGVFDRTALQYLCPDKGRSVAMASVEEGGTAANIYLLVCLRSQKLAC